MELTIEQQQALALARAKKAKAEAEKAAATPKLAPRILTDEEVEQAELSMGKGGEAGRTGAMRNVFQGITFGFADEAEAAIKALGGSKSYDENLAEIRQEMADYKELMGGEAIVQELAGGSMSPAALLKAPQKIAQAGTAAKGAYSGAVGGGIYGAGSSEGDLVDRAIDAGKGATVGALIGAPFEKLVSSVGSKQLSAAAKKHKLVPTVEHLKDLKDAAYKAVDQEQLALGPVQMEEILMRASDAAKKKYHVTLKGAPTVVERAQKMLESVRDKGLQLGQADTMRKALFNFAKDEKHGHIIRDMISEFDEVLDSTLDDASSAALKAARQAHTNYRKAETIEKAFEAIDPKTTDIAKAYQRVAYRLANDPKKMKYFSKEEKALLKGMAEGTLPTNVAHFIGKISPNSGGMMQALNVAMMVSNPWLAIGSVATAGAKSFSDKSVVKKAKKIVEQVGGIKEVQRIAEQPNAATISVSGVTADTIRNELLSD